MVSSRYVLAVLALLVLPFSAIAQRVNVVKQRVFPTTNSLTSGSALYFDGADDFVVFDTLVQHQLTADFTIEGWFLIQNGTTETTLLYRRQHADSTGFSVKTAAGNRISFDGITSDTEAFETGRWFHLAVIDSAGTKKIYINGHLKPASGTPNQLSAAAGRLEIGTDTTGTFFRGAMDEIRIWKRVLTADERNSIMFSAASTSNTDLVLYLDMEDGVPNADNQAVTSISDKSGTAALGQLNGFALTGTESNFTGSLAQVRPQGLAITGRTISTLRLSWNKFAGTPPEEVQVRVYSNASRTSPIAGSPFSENGTDRTVVVSGLNQRTRYWFTTEIKESDAPGLGILSDTVSGLTFRSAPVVSDIVPANNAVRIPVTDSVLVTLDQRAVIQNAALIQLKKEGSPVPGTTVSMKADSIVVIRFSGLSTNTTYVVEIGTGAVANTDGQVNALFTSAFTTVPRTPQLLSTKPENNSTGFHPDSAIYLLFDEVITLEDAAKITLATESNVPVGVLNVSIQDSTLKITHSRLETGTRYRVVVSEGAVENSEDGENEEISFSFTTKAVPEIVSTTPVNGATMVAVTDSVTMVFDRKVTLQDSGKVFLKKGVDVVAGTAVRFYSDSILVLKFSGLATASHFDVQVEADAVADADGLKNKTFTSSFRTAPRKPSVLQTIPLAGARLVEPDSAVKIIFSEAVTAVDVTGVTLKDAQNIAVGGIQVTVVDSTLLIRHNGMATNTEYTVTVPSAAVKNIEDGLNDGFNWTFTTRKAPPGVASAFPLLSSTTAALMDSVVITFDQKVDSADFAGIRMKTGTSELPITVVMKDSMVVVRHETLLPGTLYEVVFPEGVVKGETGLPNALYVHQFTTRPRKLLVQSKTPSDGVTKVPADITLRVAFTQVIDLENVNGVTITAMNQPVPGNISLRVEDSTLVITHDGLTRGKEYTASLAAGTVRTNEGELNLADEWRFRVLLPDPVVLRRTPAAGALKVAGDAAVSITFSQSMVETDLSKAVLTSVPALAPGEVSVRLEDSTLVFSHPRFASGAAVTVTVDAGAVRNEDGLENAAENWSFTVILDKPELLSSQPSMNATAVTPVGPIRLRYDKPVLIGRADSLVLIPVGGGDAVTLRTEVQDSSIIVRHPSLEAGKMYRLQIKSNAVLNTDSVSASPYELLFRVLMSAPRLLTSAPAAGEIRVATGAAITVKFNQGITLLDSTRVTIRPVSGSAPVITNVIMTDSTLSMLHTGMLPGVRHIASIDQGAVRNEDGVVNNPVDFIFTTILGAPAVSGVFPFANATGISIETPIEISFDRNITLHDTTKIRLVANGVPVTGLRTRLTQNRRLDLIVNPLAFLTEFEIQVDAGAVRNEDGIGNERFTSKFTTIIRAPETPQLLTPVTGDSLVIPMARFTWSAPVRAAKYTWQLSRTFTFETILQERVDHPDTTALVTAELEPLTQYFWRLRAINDGGSSDWSEIRRFVVRTLEPIPVFPAVRETGISIAPVFSWTIRKDSMRSRFQLSTDSLFSSIIYDTLTSGQTARARGLEGNRSYYWRVRIDNGDGISLWTPTRRFTTRPDPSQAESGPASVTFTFGPTSMQENTIPQKSDFRLIVMPGRDSLDVATVFTGDYQKTWRAFFEPGNGRHIEFKAEDNRFKFRPGKGFWVLSTQNVSFNQPLRAVNLKASDVYGVKVHPGWNIIGSPFRSQVSWTMVQAINNLNEPLFRFDRAWFQTDVMEPFNGYYFYNNPESPLDSLFLPYTLPDKQSVRTQPVVTTPQFALKAVFDKDLTVETSWSDKDKGVSSRYPQPDWTEQGVYMTEKNDAGAAFVHYVGVNPVLVVKALPGKPVTLSMKHMETTSEAVLLENLADGRMLLLESGSDVRFTPEVSETRFAVKSGRLTELRADITANRPADVELRPNYPNPFNPVTVIRFGLPDERAVHIEVFDVTGRRVAVLANRTFQAGWHAVSFDAKTLAGGVYLYRLTAGNQIKTGKMTLVK